jgi:hypothetical protein
MERDKKRTKEASVGELKFLRGFTFQTLGVAILHGHLRKVTFTLKVYRG